MFLAVLAVTLAAASASAQGMHVNGALGVEQGVQVKEYVEFVRPTPTPAPGVTPTPGPTPLVSPSIQSVESGSLTLSAPDGEINLVPGPSSKVTIDGDLEVTGQSGLTLGSVNSERLLYRGDPFVPYRVLTAAPPPTSGDPESYVNDSALIAIGDDGKMHFECPGATQSLFNPYIQSDYDGNLAIVSVSDPIVNKGRIALAPGHDPRTPLPTPGSTAEVVVYGDLRVEGDSIINGDLRFEGVHKMYGDGSGLTNVDAQTVMGKPVGKFMMVPADLDTSAIVRFDNDPTTPTIKGSLIAIDDDGRLLFEAPPAPMTVAKGAAQDPEDPETMSTPANPYIQSETAGSLTLATPDDAGEIVLLPGVASQVSIQGDLVVPTTCTITGNGSGLANVDAATLDGDGPAAFMKSAGTVGAGAVPRFEGTGGRDVQSSLLAIDDVGKLFFEAYTPLSVESKEEEAPKPAVPPAKPYIQSAAGGSLTIAAPHYSGEITLAPYYRVNIAAPLALSGDLAMQYGSITNAGSIGASSLNASTVSAGYLSGSSAGISNLSVYSDVSVSGTASFYGSIYGQLKAGDGSGSAPAYAFSNDTNTGMYRIGADYLGFTANGHPSFAVRPDSVQTDGLVILYAHHATPTSYPDQAQMYTQGTGTGTKIWVQDAAGTTNDLTPHAFHLYTPAAEDPAPWTHNSANVFTGKMVNADMSGALRALEALTGEQFLYYADLPADEVLDLETWRTSATLAHYEREVQNILAAEPRVQISVAEALEEAEEIETEIVEETVTRYRLNLDAARAEPYQETVQVEREVRTGRMTRRLREGVRFDEETGVCTRRRTFEDVDLATIEPPDLTLPAYVMERIPAERRTASVSTIPLADVETCLAKRFGVEKTVAEEPADAADDSVAENPEAAAASEHAETQPAASDGPPVASAEAEAATERTLAAVQPVSGGRPQ